MEQDMTKGNPLRVLLRFAIPILLGNIIQQLYNMADTIIVGRYVGTNALAAVGSTGTIMFLILGSVMGLTSGFAILTAQCYGAGDMARLRHSVANGVILALFVSLILTCAGVGAMHPILKLMNTPADIYRDAYRYIVVISGGLVTSCYYNLGSSFLRAIGNSKVPLYFLLFSAGLNVVLDLFMIIVLGMGVTGAAVATNISQGCSAVLTFLYIYKKVPALAPIKGDWHLTKGDTRVQLTIGIPMALQYAITASGTMVAQSAINLFGATAVAANTAAGKLQNLLTQGMQSLAPAVATYAGQNYGKGNYRRLVKGLRSALLLSGIFSLISMGLAVLLLHPAMHLFFEKGSDFYALLPWAKKYIYLCMIFYLPLGTIFVFRNMMQGCGFGLLPMLGGVAEFFSRLGLAIAAMHSMNYLLACFCDPGAWVAAAVYTGIACAYTFRRMKKMLTAPAAET